MAQDKQLTCRDCGQEFVFSAGEQDFYAEKGFENEPTRCPACRQARKQQSGGGRSNYGGFGSRPQREMFPAVCASCGVQTEVPFQPSGEKPVYCRDCFQSMRRY
ncbi:zinc-ribbon domain containing protein [Desulfosporosinus sp.]|uniref:zinc-ribbon domain containing protein n=1 Tax=Desulfosporosinus sp. TaxID=157907 RepID=UPI000E9B7B9E|nr:zinc-ribbon domain containing protein [Desulfosporosinus sp.]MBC2722843.1 zinc-ribbon domain containing protein [Desulfosporosinus sp.]MBC2727654.1 zinc-ribbon domain containing protein [Desulfosporosinus sp.]HBV88016.1 zinc-binding protein [Desulfosporosinus sp.]